jgi:branched-chain amino acid aminotransferase
MATLVNVDGGIVPPAQAWVSVFDRGFLYGDSVYEVIRTYGGAPFELDHHLARLAHSAERFGLAPPWDPPRTARELARTLDAARAAGGDPAPDPGAAPWNLGEWYARVVMTRGAGEIGLDPALAVDPTAIVIVQPLQGPPARTRRCSSTTAASSPRARRPTCSRWSADGSSRRRSRQGSWRA